MNCVDSIEDQGREDSRHRPSIFVEICITNPSFVAASIISRIVLSVSYLP